MENGLGQAFSDVSLVLSLAQPVSVLLVWDNASTPGDLQTSVVSVLLGQRDNPIEFHDPNIIIANFSLLIVFFNPNNLKKIV